MMLRYALAYVPSLIIFLALDAIWLSTMGPVYKAALGDILLDVPRKAPAIAFYLLYVAGLMVFALAPAFRTGAWWRAAMFGALFGLIAYATYDLTNLATLRAFTAKLTVMDLIWGAVLSAIVSTVGYWASGALLNLIRPGAA